MTLPVRGVHYDVGHDYDAGGGQGTRSTRPHFDRAGVAADMAMIAGQLHANAYRDNSNAAGYRDLLRGYRRFGKPVVVTEFGCCTYQGAADAGGAGFMIVDYDPRSQALKLKGTGLRRGEAEQARYLTELLATFHEERIRGAFWHTFADWAFPYRPDPREDLDLGSFGLVKVIQDPSAGKDELAREPKEAFWALAAAYWQADGQW